jgi:glutamate 5-kinase
MLTKIVAARLAASAGVTTIITRASSPGNITKLVRYLQRGAVHDDAGGTSSNPADAIGPSHVEQPPLHTRFLPSPEPIRDRHFWILHGLAPHGTLYIDVGAHRALLGKAGLLPAGVIEVEGTFAQQEAVRLVVVERRSTPNLEGRLWDGPGTEVGRALVNYAASESARIKGHQSTQIGALLGYADSEYVAQR